MRHISGEPDFWAWSTGLLLVATTIRAMTRAELTERGSVKINLLNRNDTFQGDRRADISIQFFFCGICWRRQGELSVFTYRVLKLKMPHRVFSHWNCLRWTSSERCCCWCQVPHSQSRISGPSESLWLRPLSQITVSFRLTDQLFCTNLWRIIFLELCPELKVWGYLG